LIDDPSLLQENGHDEISIKAMGRAINKTVMVVELIKVGLNSLLCLTIVLLKLLSVSVFELALNCSSREELEVFIRTLLLNLLISRTHGSLWKKAFSRKDMLPFFQSSNKRRFLLRH